MAVAENGHSQSLHATLAEHKQHLANMQVYRLLDRFRISLEKKAMDLAFT